MPSQTFNKDSDVADLALYQFATPHHFYRFVNVPDVTIVVGLPHDLAADVTRDELYVGSSDLTFQMFFPVLVVIAYVDDNVANFAVRFKLDIFLFYSALVN